VLVVQSLGQDREDGEEGDMRIPGGSSSLADKPSMGTGSKGGSEGLRRGAARGLGRRAG